MGGVDIECPFDITSSADGREGRRTGMLAVFRAGHADEEIVVKTLSAAFFESNRVVSWLVRGGVEYRRIVVARFARALVGHALVYGVIRVSNGRDAVAISYPGRPPWSRGVEGEAIATALGRNAGRFERLVHRPTGIHPRLAHECLAFLAVRPDRQGRDLERRLLYDRIGACQSRRLPIYFEAPDPGVRMLCLSMGFADREIVPQVLPHGPELHPLVWKPRS